MSSAVFRIVGTIYGARTVVLEMDETLEQVVFVSQFDRHDELQLKRFIRSMTHKMEFLYSSYKRNFLVMVEIDCTCSLA